MIFRALATIGLLVVLFPSLPSSAQTRSAKHRHWRLTENETLWIGRYSNCQYGYYAFLPNGAVAHAEHPPSPHHGFVVRLPEVDMKTEVTFDNSDRLIWINAEYNTTEESTLRGVADYELDLARREKTELVGWERVKLQSVPAIRFRIEYGEKRRRVVEEELVTQRADIIYEVGLKTSSDHYAQDHQWLEKLLAGLRFLPLNKCECWNE